jgi:formamidopyrimidine-DNA glycosylase
MPELPEVETVRRGLLKRLPGKTITGVRVLRAESIACPDPAQFARQIKGKTFGDVWRRGKYVIFELNRGAKLVAHLRMSGRLLVGKKLAVRQEHVRVRLQLDNGEELVFEDMRVFGRLWYVPQSRQVEEIVPALAELGPEPLENLSAAYMQAQLATRKQPIKSALLDQTLIAGIGNIYADESLHLSGINPSKPSRELNYRELTLLCKNIKQVLRRAIELRGSSLRNYTDSAGVNGGYQNRAHVYGREGEPCHNCGTRIERVKLSGRSSHFCPTCQK